MALTRPRIAQINTTVTALTDAITVLNAGATSANVDSGFLINRAHGLISNAAIYYSETLDTFVTAFTSNSGGTDSNIVISNYVDFTTGNVYSTGIHVTGNVDFTFSPNVSLGDVGNVYITGGVAGQILQTTGNGELVWVDNTPSTITYTANTVSLTGGVYVSGNVDSIKTFGDYAVTNGTYTLTDGTGTAPAWIFGVNFVDIVNFNRIVMNINYTQSSGHTIYVQLYNYNTTVWDSLGTYTGLGSYYAFALQVIDDVDYISSGNVQLRLYHSNTGNAGHTTNIDYVALELSSQGPQGPRGPTGATGSTGPGVATGGTVGQVLVKNSGTNYDTAWASNLTLANLNLIGTGDISSNIGSYQFWANTSISSLQSNAAIQASLIDILTGNAATQGSLLDVLVANAAVQSANLTYLLSNAAAQEASLTSLVNNAASQTGAIDSINANIGAYQTWSNANAAVQAISIDSLNANIIATNAAIITANTGMKSYVDDQIIVASGYGNTQVGAYLLTNAGNIAAGNISVTGNIVGGSVRTTTSATAPANPTPGDMWYDTATDILFRYTDVGTSRYWLDINGQTLSFDLSGNVVAGNVVARGYYWSNGAPFVSSTYGDANVAAYLGPYYTYANANAASQSSAIATLQTQVYANSNVAAYLTSNITVGNVIPTGNNVVNLGSPTARFGSLYLAGNTIDLGGTVITTTANGSIVISGDLTISGNVSAAVPFYSNANVASYLTTYTGNVAANNITTTGNVTASALKTSNGLFWANGTAYSSGVTQARAWATTMLFGG